MGRKSKVKVIGKQAFVIDVREYRELTILEIEGCKSRFYGEYQELSAMTESVFYVKKVNVDGAIYGDLMPLVEKIWIHKPNEDLPAFIVMKLNVGITLMFDLVI